MNRRREFPSFQRFYHQTSTLDRFPSRWKVWLISWTRISKRDFIFTGRSCPRGRKLSLRGGDERFRVLLSLSLSSPLCSLVFPNEIIKRERFHEGRNWTEEGNAIIFTRLITRFHVPTSIERHACTHAAFLSSCLRFKALSFTAYDSLSPVD